MDQNRPGHIRETGLLLAATSAGARPERRPATPTAPATSARHNDRPSHSTTGDAATFHPSPPRSPTAEGSRSRVENPLTNPATAPTARPQGTWKIPPPTAPVAATPCPFSTWPLPHRTTCPPLLATACRQHRPPSRRAVTAARKTRAGYDPNADPHWKIAGHSIPPPEPTPGLTPALPGRTPAAPMPESNGPGCACGAGTADGGGGEIRGFHPHPRAALRAARPHSTVVERHTPAARLIGPRYFRTVPSW